MTHDDELIERVGVCLHKNWLSDDKPFSAMGAEYRTEFLRVAQMIVAAVRAYDAERRASVLDAAAAATLIAGGLVDISGNGHHLMPRAPVAQQCVGFDPDDYRDLPVSLERPVRFEGGLTADKRK